MSRERESNSTARVSREARLTEPEAGALPIVARASCPCESHGRDARATIWRRIFWSILIGIQLLAGGARAADKLEVDLIPAALRVRSQAPIPVQARFRWSGTHILEGHLEVELHEGNRILTRFRSGDMALTTGEQTFHMVLPPCVDPYSDSQVEAQTKFVTKDQVLDLGYSILFMPTTGERSFVLGWCSAHSSTEQQTATLQSFLFERMAPPNANVARKLLITSPVRLAPEDLPAQPLAYTSFDVMVLTADAFKEAREGQLKALARWVKGGGSVCVFVTGGLRPYHVTFLNELAGSSVVDPAYVVDTDGNLLPGQKKISCLYSGVGRSVVITATAADAIADASEWRRAVAFLWKFRAKEVRSISQKGYWEEEANMSEATNDPQAQFQQYQRLQQSQQGVRRFQVPNNYYGERLSYSIQPTTLGFELLGQLMPRTVRLIPFSALMGMLGLFLLMIGPVDYFVLGWLRRRKYTWILFPATSLAFMIATVLMANYYLGLHDQRRSLIVVDLDKDGTALRWNRYELVFAARDKQAVTDLKDALWAPLEATSFPVGMPYNPRLPYPNGPQGYAYNYSYGNPRAARARETGPPWYDGAMPVHFRTSQSLNQWQPKLNRIFSFEAPPVPLLPNWPAIEAAWPKVEDIQAKLSAGKIVADVRVFSSASGISNLSAVPDPQSPWILSFPLLGKLCYGEATGLFSIVSQVSPTGGGNFEDAQAMDIAGGDSVLAIVTYNGEDIVVYRRFFHGK